MSEEINHNQAQDAPSEQVDIPFESREQYLEELRKHLGIEIPNFFLNNSNEEIKDGTSN
jgi:hypothetical protein